MAIIICVLGFFALPILALAAYSIPTLLHSIGVAIVAKKFAKVMGYGFFKTSYMVANAIFHDVGKLGVSRKILHGTHRLSKEERDEINTHTSNIIARVYGIVFPAAIGHHVNHTGNGYGAEKTQSEVSAFIEICDVFDALTGLFRKYTSRRPMEVIARIMNEEKSKFNPAMFSLFMANFDTFEPSKFMISLDDLYKTEKNTEKKEAHI